MLLCLLWAFRKVARRWSLTNLNSLGLFLLDHHRWVWFSLQCLISSRQCTKLWEWNLRAYILKCKALLRTCSVPITDTISCIMSHHSGKSALCHTQSAHFGPLHDKGIPRGEALPCHFQNHTDSPNVAFHIPHLKNYFFSVQKTSTLRDHHYRSSTSRTRKLLMCDTFQFSGMDATPVQH